MNSNSLAFRDWRENELMLVSPIDSVIRYTLHMNKNKGTIGQLFLTNFRLKFINYEEIENELKTKKSSISDNLKEKKYTQNFPPFDLHPFSEENRVIQEQDIELFNIYDFRNDQDTQFVSLSIFCNDFRCIEFQIKNCESIKTLIEKLRESINGLLSSSSFYIPSNLNKSQSKPFLWPLLSHYSYTSPQDWSSKEGHWLSRNKLFEISQCNQNFELCPTLPSSFVTLSNNLTNSTFLKSIMPLIKNGRIPLITFAYQTNTVQCNLLLRSSSLNEEVINILNEAISPLKIIEVSSIFPSLTKLISFYNKLKKACSLYGDTSRFMSQTGKWLQIVSKLLSCVSKMVHTLKHESSLLLMEDNDNYLNRLLSSLIQIVMDKKRRTITGFENLISKEWIYLSGLENSYFTKSYDLVLFTLFLDSVWQLLVQNDTYFEFTSLYLIRLYDLQTIPWNRGENLKKDKPSHSLNLSNPITLFNLDLTQLLFFYNAFYSSVDDSDDALIKFNSNLISLTLWRPLYLRWFPLSHHVHFYSYCPASEFVQYSFLLSKYGKTSFNQKRLSSFSSPKENSREEESYISYL